jgi:pimeloyl-ACP methyl ester carboxylesterase
MMRFLKGLLIFISVVLVLVVLLPLVVPLPPLSNTTSIDQLADPDSKFIEVNGLKVHYKKYGAGEPVMILLHGFGASVYSWQNVIQPLSETGTVIAYDRPAFGLTERPMPSSWTGETPYGVEANIKLLFGLMDALGVQKAVLVGNSVGGRLAVQAALAQPERVSGLVLVDAAIYTGSGDRLGPFLSRGIAGAEGTSFIQAAWHDPTKITPEITAGYRQPLRVPDWDRALWEFTKAGSGSEDLAPRLKELKMPVLVLAGDDDRIVPTTDSIRLGSEIPGAALVVFPACGHVPQEECPAPFLKAVQDFMAKQ